MEMLHDNFDAVITFKKRKRVTKITIHTAVKNQRLIPLFWLCHLSVFKTLVSYCPALPCLCLTPLLFLPSYLRSAVSLSPSVCVSPLIHLLCGAAPVWPSQAEPVSS